ncbi:MAG: hypothetical protein INQ03_22390 [Candidatus Heimdallarchaeota archaeon]|nr:hypothetical protein [Candidatus Heimdallarchaeota archaeon]
MIDDMVEILNTQLRERHFGVFISFRNNIPHPSLVAFTPVDDLQRLVFFTRKNTRKMINSLIHSKVSMYLDTITNVPEQDIKNAVTITAYGQVAEQSSFMDNYDQYRKVFLEKNPHMSFYLNQDIEMIVINVDHYEVVKNFQKIIDLQVINKSQSFTLGIRQIISEGTSDGEARGKIVTSIKEISENSIIFIDKFPEDYSGPVPAGIIEINGSDDSPGTIYAKNHNIPCVVKVEDAGDSIESGESVSINGYLGIIILHKIK